MSLLSGLSVPSGGGILFWGFHCALCPPEFFAFKVTATKGEGTMVESVFGLCGLWFNT